jgi:pimeloyl-ACP methyl ester carboxylesterase
MPRKAMRDVVVVLPGITGSVLQKNGKDVWNVSGGAVLGALLSLGRNVKDLQLEEDPPDVDDLGDGVTATSVIRDVHLIPGLWKIDGYSKCVQHVLDTFDVERGRNFFEFPYDWRRDNRVAARKLARESERWLADWREHSGADDAKLILIGHSMGGLISRYFLECLDGWRTTRVLLTFGTPYRGSMNAVATLAHGMRKKIGPIGIDLSALARSFTAIYQLLPTYPCVDTGDGDLLRVADATIANVDQARARAALEFHEEIRLAVEGHEREDEYRKGSYDIRPVIGILQPTSQSVRLTDGRVQLLRSRRGKDDGGDGTVPRASATPRDVEREANAMFATERHASLQNDDPVLDQVTGVLSGLEIDWDAYRTAVPAVGLGLDVDDAYAPGEPVRVRARPEEEPPDLLNVHAENVETGEKTAAQTMRLSDDGWYEAELGPFPEGAYRVTAFGAGAVEPVTDVFLVLADDDGP